MKTSRKVYGGWQLALPLTLLASGCHHVSIADNWQQVTAEDGSFTFSMPGKPKMEEQTLNGPNGAFPVHTYTYSNLSIASYQFGYADYPASAG